MQGRLLDENCFEATGAFRRMLDQEVPQMIAMLEDHSRVVAYAACMPCTDEFFAYLPDRLGVQQLGLAGVWVRPDCRGEGHGAEVLSILGRALEIVPAHRFILSMEDPVVSWAQKRLPLYVLPRWAWQQPAPDHIKREIRQRNPALPCAAVNSCELVA